MFAEVFRAQFLVTICAINFFGVKWYGEAEFWFSLIKVLAIIGLIILGIVLDLGGGPTHDRIGFRASPALDFRDWEGQLKLTCSPPPFTFCCSLRPMLLPFTSTCSHTISAALCPRTGYWKNPGGAVRCHFRPLRAS